MGLILFRYQTNSAIPRKLSFAANTKRPTMIDDVCSHLTRLILGKKKEQRIGTFETDLIILKVGAGGEGMDDL